jgi:hypothetical protein
MDADQLVRCAEVEAAAAAAVAADNVACDDNGGGDDWKDNSILQSMLRDPSVENLGQAKVQRLLGERRPRIALLRFLKTNGSLHFEDLVSFPLKRVQKC